MKFIVSSTELLSHLQVVNRVISNKNTLPILDNFLFSLKGNELTITASDLETTLVTSMVLDNVTEGGITAIPAKVLIETLKNTPEQPLTFDINTDNQQILIQSEHGKYTIVGQNGEEFPALPDLDGSVNEISMNSSALLCGIEKTIFATADDELRPVMNGVFIEMSSEDVTFVASDAHKLVRYKRTDLNADDKCSFILPKKPSGLLRNVLPKGDESVHIKFDSKNVYFTLPNYMMVCRLVEGNYPAYNSVIPANNPNKVVIDRVGFLSALKRVSVYSNQASNLIKLSLSGNNMEVSAQDLDFSISGKESLTCQYEGDEMAIGFKSLFLIEILSNLNSDDIVLELSDPTRAGLLLPLEKDNEQEDVLMLLMPMMVNG
ncbi:MAG: DNA polymerase III subunit beta [Bacteroidales bacterium]|jgi:DNA polymerase-3 subunit beta|nr:DNA polymerase III subunit beta [Bacteroidales bacterium]